MSSAFAVSAFVEANPRVTELDLNPVLARGDSNETLDATHRRARVTTTSRRGNPGLSRERLWSLTVTSADQ